MNVCFIFLSCLFAVYVAKLPAKSIYLEKLFHFMSMPVFKYFSSVYINPFRLIAAAAVTTTTSSQNRRRQPVECFNENKKKKISLRK